LAVSRKKLHSTIDSCSNTYMPVIKSFLDYLDKRYVRYFSAPKTLTEIFYEEHLVLDSWSKYREGDIDHDEPFTLTWESVKPM